MKTVIQSTSVPTMEGHSLKTILNVIIDGLSLTIHISQQSTMRTLTLRSLHPSPPSNIFISTYIREVTVHLLRSRWMKQRCISMEDTFQHLKVSCLLFFLQPS